MIDNAKLENFVHKAVGDLGSALTAALVVIGDKARSLQGDGGRRTADLGRAGEAHRHQRALRARVARRRRRRRGTSPTTRRPARYELPAEQAVALADEESPACVLGGFQGMTAAMKAAPTVAEAFRHGHGMGWHEHDPDLFAGTERFFRPGYNANLVERVDPGAATA